MCVPIHDKNDKMIGALSINRDITERINEAERLSHLAHYDQLTKIPNRFAIFLSHKICWQVIERPFHGSVYPHKKSPGGLCRYDFGCCKNNAVKGDDFQKIIPVYSLQG